MKRLFKLPVLVLGLVLLLTGAAQKVAAQEEDVSMQTFYDELSPYGTWIQDSQYGYVWRPDVDQSDFRPYYTNGRWVMTEYGNTWVSDYNWGWAPFHYGRWVYNRYNEWLWIPDTTWGPAWVSWRSGGGYYGWAPLAPGINININFGGGYRIPNSWWCFVPQSNIYYDRFPRYGGYNNVTIINNTTIINNVYRGGRNTYFTGPGRDDIRRATNRDVRIYNVNRTSRPDRGGVTNNTVNIYNPRPSRGNDGRPAAPRNVSSESTYTASRGDRGGRPTSIGNIGNDRNNNVNGNRGDRGSTTTVPNDGNTRPGVTPGRDYNRPDNGRPSRVGTQPVNEQGHTTGNPATPPSRTDRTPSTQQWQRPEGQSRPEGTSRQYQPQRWQTRPVQPQQPQQQPQQPQRQSQPQPQYQRPERQPQPQAQPQRPQQAQPQQTRPQRVQQSAPPRETRAPEQQNRGDRGSRSERN